MASGSGDEPTGGLIFSIQHFCLHDGPGIRSVVFFKGCPLQCTWCQNPESWLPGAEIAFKPHLCSGCRTCIDVCPEDAIPAPGQVQQEKCRQCFACTAACPSEALVRFGEDYPIASVLEELRSEYPFYKSSGGGVTFSGGEPTLSAGTAVSLARRLKRDGIHLTLETCGLFKAEPLAKSGSPLELVSLSDLVLFDIKLFWESDHRRHCGAANQLILNNLTLLSCRFEEGGGPPVWPRMPVIPGITDTEENIHGWGRFLKEHSLYRLTLVPYHNLGESKRKWLHLPPGPNLAAPSQEEMAKIRRRFSAYGITCHSPGEEEWPSLA